VRAVTATTTRVTKRARATRAMMEPSPREEGEDGPPPAARVHNNREGDDEGGKGNGGRGYEDNGDNGSDGGDNDAKRR
jgi:hypothetical protein